MNVHQSSIVVRNLFIYLIFNFSHRCSHCGHWTNRDCSTQAVVFHTRHPSWPPTTATRHITAPATSGIRRGSARTGFSSIWANVSTTTAGRTTPCDALTKAGSRSWKTACSKGSATAWTMKAILWYFYLIVHFIFCLFILYKHLFWITFLCARRCFHRILISLRSGPCHFGQYQARSALRGTRPVCRYPIPHP